MTAFDNATKLFHACESAKSWEACKDFATEDATFGGQCEPTMEIKTVKDYTNWMAGMVAGPIPDFSYELNSSSYDSGSNTAMFFGTFKATHTGEGAPIPATNKSTTSDYVYIMNMNDSGKVTKITKVWNAGWAMRELGWA